MMRKRLAAVVGLLAMASSAFGADWPQWRGPGQNGMSDEKDLADAWPAGGPQILWKTEVGPGMSSPIVAGDRVYVAATDLKAGKAVVVCLDKARGQVLWSVPFDASRKAASWQTQGPFSTCTLDVDRIYIMNSNGRIACISIPDKAVLWSSDLAAMGATSAGWGISSSVLIHENLAVITPVAFDKMTGKIVWSAKTTVLSAAKEKGAPPVATEVLRVEHSTPVRITVAGQDQTVFHAGSGVVAVDPLTGRELWSAQGKGVDPGYGPIFTPLWTGDRLVAAVREGTYGGPLTVLKVGPDAGPKGWAVDLTLPGFPEPVRKIQCSSPVCLDGHLYGIVTEIGRHSIVCVSLKDGKAKWSEKAPDRSWSSPVLADGKVYQLLNDGTLVMYRPSPESYQELGRFQVVAGKCAASPALSDGRLFVRDETSVICVKISK
jgi:outer membrane protein assembly factor BamB